MEAAMVVLSGGQDSTTCLFWAKQHFKQVYALSFDYGQKHVLELSSASRIADLAGVPLAVDRIPHVLHGRSPLTNPAEHLETYNTYQQMEQVIGNRVELTFVPMRNALFLTIAANHAAAAGYFNLVTGVCQADNANYPDCRARFVVAMENMVEEALDHEFHIHAPLLHVPKAQSIALALTLPGCYNALAYSHTSYEGTYPPLGKDHANVLRTQGFLDAGHPDPLVVRAWSEGLMKLPDTANYDVVRRDVHQYAKQYGVDFL